MEDWLMHKGHKYIYKKKVNGKWRYYYNPNRYESNPKNYEKVKAELTKDKEWRDIVSRKDPEYTYTDDNGKTQYNYDKYLLNKKHPVLDALTDYGSNRKVSVLKQDSETFVAGAKDYIEMGRRSVETLASVGAGILSLKIMNQQGSLEEKKKELKGYAKAAKSMAKDALNQYNAVSANKDSIKKAVTSQSTQAIQKELKKYYK